MKKKTMPRKKLKIAMLNEVGFMVKLRFEVWNWCFANVYAPVLQLNLGENLSSIHPFFLTELIEKCSFCPLQI